MEANVKSIIFWMIKFYFYMWKSISISHFYKFTIHACNNNHCLELLPTPINYQYIIMFWWLLLLSVISTTNHHLLQSTGGLCLRWLCPRFWQSLSWGAHWDKRPTLFLCLLHPGLPGTLQSPPAESMWRSHTGTGDRSCWLFCKLMSGKKPKWF